MKKQNKKFYVTTAIDYVNADPHIGHAYQKIIADAFVRWHRLKGQKVRFLTGTDEHGQKISGSAKAAGLNEKDFVDKISKKFTKLFLLSALIVPWSTSVALADDDALKRMAGMVNYYKSRSEVIRANTGDKSSYATSYSTTLSAQAGYLKAQGDNLKSRVDVAHELQKILKTQQEIRAMRIENALKYTEMYYKRRQISEKYHASRQKTRRSPGKLSTVAKKKNSVPARFALQELDNDGKILWPYVLTDKRFEAGRKKLESIFAKRSRGLGSREFHEIKIVTDVMTETLKSIIREIPPVEYLAAKKLLKGLAYEARFAPEKKQNRFVVKQVSHTIGPG